jgi:hypothetical protein
VHGLADVLATCLSRNGSAVFAAVSCASGELAPNTVVMSPGFSSTMFAVEKSPTVQPARVNGTHGAGVILPSWPTIDGVVSTGFGTGGPNAFVSMIGDVQ